MAASPPVEGVDFEIVVAAGRWIWHCLRCDTREYGDWDEPSRARTSYESHDCMPCPVCRVQVRIVGAKEKPASERLLPSHYTPRGHSCPAGARRLSVYERPRKR